MTDIDFSTAQSPFGDQVLETAFHNVLGELEALSPDELSPVNIDILAAVNTAAGVIPEIQAFRAQIVRELPLFDILRFDKLSQYAMAAAYAHTEHLVSSQPQDRLRPLFEEAVSLRETLLGDATVLSNRGLINSSVLHELKGAVGYKNLQIDLQMLVNVLKANWPNIVGKCATTAAELARGEKLVSWLIQAVGLKEQGPAEKAKSADVRVRSFTLFARTYNEARRAISYLRWDAGDLDDIIPSLWAGRGGRKKESAAEPTPEAPVATATPTQVHATNGAAAVPPSTAVSPSPAVPTPAGGPFAAQ